jgi:FixJ family two-component response regulator
LPDLAPLVHVVDDDPSVILALKRLLNSWGMQVRTFGSGEEFLSALRRSHDGDCSVIDVQMPGMTGLEVQEHMNRTGINLPVIFITGHEEEGVEEHALRAGAAGFLRKPFTDDDLINLIRNALQHRLVPPETCKMEHEKRKEDNEESVNEGK